MNTPARLERDSRPSSVSIALPAPVAISSAMPASPASRAAATGLRRKWSRYARAGRTRSSRRAAASASAGVTSRLPAAAALAQRPGHDRDHRQEEAHPEDRQPPPRAGGRGEVAEPCLVAKREPRREARREHRPGDTRGGVT